MLSEHISLVYRPAAPSNECAKHPRCKKSLYSIYILPSFLRAFKARYLYSAHKKYHRSMAFMKFYLRVFTQ